MLNRDASSSSPSSPSTIGRISFTHLTSPHLSSPRLISLLLSSLPLLFTTYYTTHTDVLFLPDCDTCLRLSSLLLANDDEWLSVRAKDRLGAAGLFLLHPSISLPTAEVLGVYRISTVFVEKLYLPLSVFPEEWTGGDSSGEDLKRFIVII
jgi:hypothetical protein